MIRFYLIVTLPLFALFTTIMLLIHAEPYDDHELRALLMPEGCLKPCFMGIRPGITSYLQALAIVDAHAWVGQVEVSDYYYIYGAGKIIQWSWNSSEPEALKPQWTERLSSMKEQNGVINQMVVATNIPLGDLWLMFGRPERSNVHLIMDMTLMSDHLYSEVGLEIGGRIHCPLTLDGFWNTPQILTFFYNEDIMRSTDGEGLSAFLQKFRGKDDVCGK